MEKGSPSPRPSLPKTFAAGSAGMSALVSVQQGESPSAFPGMRDARFIIASANHGPQPSKNQRPMRLWAADKFLGGLMRIPDLFPDTLD